MKGIDELKNELVQAILESTEYKEYKEMQQEMDRNPDIKRIVDEYRKRNFALQYNGEEGDLFAATQQLSQEYEDIKRQIMVRRYLDSEICLCREIQDICMSIIEAVDFNVEFLK